MEAWDKIKYAMTKRRKSKGGDRILSGERLGGSLSLSRKSRVSFGAGTPLYLGTMEEEYAKAKAF